MKTETIDVIDSALSYIRGELVNTMSDEDSLLFINWTKKKLSDTLQCNKESLINSEIKTERNRPTIDYKKIKYLKKKKKKYEHVNYNHNLKIGDIVYVNYGFGYCGELSLGHYGVIMSEIKNNMYFVVTLSSDPLNMFPYFLDNLNLPNSDCDKNKLSYVRFEQARFLHYRRLENITIQGDVLYRSLTEPQITQLKEKFLEFMQISIDKV